MESIWLKKQNCSICNKKFLKSDLKECKTIDNRQILCCERCSKYIKKE